MRQVEACPYLCCACLAIPIALRNTFAVRMKSGPLCENVFFVVVFNTRNIYRIYLPPSKYMKIMIPFLEELRQRGMLHNTIPGTEEQLSKEMTSAYIGFDPTAPSLHIGNLATIMLLKHLQLAGHRPVIVLGGATGMIGDPSFKAKERVLLDKDTLIHHQACLKKQLMKMLDFSGSHAALLVNNYDWFKNMNVLSFLRDVGKHLTVNYMMAKESVKNRLATGLSYTEFAYQLMQAYDFYHLYVCHGVKMQMGGADQWGNLTAGVELIRKKTGKAAYAITTPLITKADGTKFGKTEAGNIWLDPRMTSPYAFYQFWLNCSDEDASMLIKRMTLYSLEDISAIVACHVEAPHKRLLQKALAKSLTLFVHGKLACEQAVQTSDILFGDAAGSDLYNLEEEVLLESLAGIPSITLNSKDVRDCTSLVHLLTDVAKYKIFSSRREAREIMSAGGVYINKKRIKEEVTPKDLDWLHGKYLFVQKGKKNFYVIKKQCYE